ncbi:aldo/keto reductase [Microbacterium sp. KSW4-11]|uniref:Aldo/keto reductase n=1 Tax=Microbacterium gawkjiense TaxID=3067309 RepID=A0ABU3G651_9MICO|nr:aldo/keto reductase [Microbacterium sp. KSW4-11]MDT3315284.1 aldo/keto reductase [Microbacterium sp. KSW4-11]
MKTTALGQNGPRVGRIGLGLMGISAFYTGAGQDDAGGARTILGALDRGVTLLDTAEMYGPYTNEELLGRTLAEAGRRDEVVIATKFGTIRHTDGDQPGIDGSPDNVRTAVEGSLRRLQTDRIDLYYQHRMDPSVPIEDTVGVLADLVREGKIGGYGLSEASVATIRRAHAVHPMTAVQTEYSLWTRDPEAELLPALRELGIGFVPYSPLGRGFLTGRIRSVDQLDEDDFRRNNPRFEDEALAANLRIVDVIEGVAGEVDATPAQVALAWLLAQGEDIVPIPGTRKLERVDENIGATELALTDDQLRRLSGVGPAVGDRYADMSSVNR